MISNISLLVSSMKNLATKGREKIICDKTNQLEKKINDHKLNADFLMFLFAKHTKIIHANASFSFSVSLMLWMQKRN